MCSSVLSARKTIDSARHQRPKTAISPRMSVSKKEKDFTPEENQQLSATSRINAELSTHPAAYQGQIKFPFHSIPSRLGKLSIEDKLDHPFKTEETNQTDTQTRSKTGDYDNLYVSFDLLKTMTPRNCVKCLNTTPIFLKTLFLQGHLDPDLVSNVSLSLTSNELQKFVLNMTSEINCYTSLLSCQSINEIEEKVKSLMPVQYATVWIKSEFANYAISETRKEILTMGQTILTEAFNKKEDLVMGDPANHVGFSVEYDLPLVRGCKSMILLPIVNPNDEIVAVFQVAGYTNELTDMQTEFPQYYIESLKIFRDIIQRRFFTIQPQRKIPSNTSNVFNDIENSSLQKTSAQICKFLQNTIPCESAELYIFDDRYRSLIRISDNKEFGELEGGISFQAGLTTVPIVVAHGQNHPKFNKDIDGHYSNKSIISRSLFQGRDHFVVTLRAKPNSPSFSPADLRLLADLATIICDALKLSKWLSKQAESSDQMKHDIKILTLITNSLSDVTSKGVGAWDAIKEASNEFFQSKQLFICLFDGRYMKYTPKEIKCRFEDCVAGTSYNYRETVYTKAEDENPKFSAALYSQLDVKCESSLCFPYRVNGRVMGAIEIINPKVIDHTTEELKLFANLCSCLLNSPFTTK